MFETCFNFFNSNGEIFRLEKIFLRGKKFLGKKILWKKKKFSSTKKNPDRKNLFVTNSLEEKNYLTKKFFDMYRETKKSLLMREKKSDEKKIEWKKTKENIWKKNCWVNHRKKSIIKKFRRKNTALFVITKKLFEFDWH